jgi:hypothetical protein
LFNKYFLLIILMIKLLIGYLLVNLQTIIGQDTDSPSASISGSPSTSSAPSGTCMYRTYNAATDFSGTQGRNGWYYGYYNNGVFTQFTNYAIASPGSLGNVYSWNYNVASNGNIGSSMIMPNGATSCNTPSYGNIAPVLRWYNPIGSCYQDVTISLHLSPGTTSVVPLLKANGCRDIYFTLYVHWLSTNIPEIITEEFCNYDTL